jgi:aspartate/methionine/tyrosine aminotransferase
MEMPKFAEIVDSEVTLEKMRRKRGRSKWNRYDPDVIPLMLSDPDYPVPPEIREAALQAVKDDCWNYAWFPEAIEAMAETTRTKYGIDATVDDLMITPGVAPGIKLSAMYACKPGDEVIVQSHMYSPFLRAVNSVGAKNVYLEINPEDNWRFDTERLKELVTHRTRLIFLCNPHNPVGRVNTKEELKGIADVAVDRNLIVATDDLHSDYIFDGRKHISIASLGPEIADRTISMFGLSKTFGLAGLHIGWVVATNKEIMGEVRKHASGLNRGTCSISLAVAHAVLTKCEGYLSPLVEYVQNLRDYGVKRLRAMGKVKVVPPEGTYVLWPDISAYGLSSSEMSKHLLEKGRVATSDGSRYGPGGEGYLRLVFPTSMAIFKEGLDRIEGALSKL